MAIEHLTNEQLDSIKAHCVRRRNRYARMLRALNDAMEENEANHIEAKHEIERRIAQRQMRQGKRDAD